MLLIGELSDHHRANPIPKENQWHREREGEGAQDTIDRKCGVNDLEIENFTDIRYATVHELLFTLFSVVFKPMGNTP